MTAHHIPNGVSSYYVYDEYTRKGKVIENCINNGQTYHFDYFDDHTIVTQAKDTPNESTTTYHFDKNKRWVGITDGLGHHTAFILDDYDRLIKQIDPDGSIQSFDYAGNELTTTSTLIDTEPLTLRPIWRSHRYLYKQGRLSELIDPNGNSTQLNYDDYGQLIRMTDAEGHTTHLERDEQGRVVREILANGSSYAYTYDKAGNLLTQTDCSGFTTSYCYDEQGRVIKVTDPKGNHTHYHYDTKTTRTLSPTAIHYPDGSQEFFVYDELQRLITHKDPKGHQTDYEYDTDDLPSKRIDAEGHTLYYHYDNKRRLVKLTNENNEDWCFFMIRQTILSKRFALMAPN